MDFERIGLIVGIFSIFIGIIISYYFYRKSLKIRQPYWAIRSNNLIYGFCNIVDDLEITFESEPVENLTISKIIFWNNGLETINYDDLTTINPLRIKGISETKILQASIIRSNNKSSNFTLEYFKEDNKVKINFDYLDQNQGVVIQVIHTGKSSKDIEILGDIKGVKSITQRFSYPRWLKKMGSLFINKKFLKSILKSYEFIIGPVFIILGILNFFPTIRNILEKEVIIFPEYWKGFVHIFAGFFIIIFSMYILRRNSFSSIPKGLESFLSESIPFDSE